jgi:type IV fimbrial biogenesis protein FimT
MHNKGFTLVELMVVIAIVAIVSAIALPSLTAFIDSTRFSAQANDLVAALSYARSEAVKRNADVSICPSTDGAACASSSSWSTGWLVTLADGTVLQVYPALKSGITLTASASGSLDYRPSGQSTTRTFNLCSSGRSRGIQVSQTGRVAMTNPANGC